jgi:hypothetical protein
VSSPHADTAAGQRPVRRDLPIAPTIYNVIETHPESVQPDGDECECDTLCGIEFMPEDTVVEPDLILGPQHQRAAAVRQRGEDERHPR